MGWGGFIRSLQLLAGLAGRVALVAIATGWDGPREVLVAFAIVALAVSELARARREGRSLCVAILDLDRFKLYNDANGHPAGDRLLRTAGSAWKLAVRASDFIARYGGEEFAVLLPDCGLEEAETVIERLRGVTPEAQTVSAGIAEWNVFESTAALIDRVDFALYRAKRDGRDRSVCAASGSGVAPSR
jgi:diguanylate cyclase (GGDEF)-like protein